MSIFVLKREYALQLPNSYVEIDRDEMEYVDGGGVSLAMSTSYLNKDTCLSKADVLIRSYQVRLMTKYQIAKEIYAHAVIYYASPATLAILGPIVGAPLLSYLRSHANPIDIADGGDSASRESIYNAIWNTF